MPSPQNQDSTDSKANSDGPRGGSPNSNLRCVSASPSSTNMNQVAPWRFQRGCFQGGRETGADERRIIPDFRGRLLGHDGRHGGPRLREGSLRRAAHGRLLLYRYVHLPFGGWDRDVPRGRAGGGARGEPGHVRRVQDGEGRGLII